MFKFLSNDGLNIEIRQLLNKLQPLKVQNLPKQNSQTRQRRKNSNLYCTILIQHSGTLCDNCSELLLTRLIAMMCRLAELLTTQHISIIHSLFIFYFHSVFKSSIMVRLSRDQINQAIGMSIVGLSFSRIAIHLNVHRSTICRLLRRQRQTGGVADARRTGRPRVTTAGQDRCMSTFI